MRTPSPTGNVDDSDYIDLLLEYQEIKKQLENLEDDQPEKGRRKAA